MLMQADLLTLKLNYNQIWRTKMSAIKTKTAGKGRLSDRMQQKHQHVAASVRANEQLVKSLFTQVSRQTDAFEILMDEVTMLRAVVKRSEGFTLTEVEEEVAQEWADSFKEDKDEVEALRGENSLVNMYDEVQSFEVEVKA